MELIEKPIGLILRENSGYRTRKRTVAMARGWHENWEEFGPETALHDCLAPTK
ncbi:hypothetical protein [Pseudoruegeria sp. HB172150]|uniref:hypothetical protein n=1 Tax=Pseudoruegeria sp. HB172150 TaxID=2721164 RepID=UPI0015534E66|nr:hypothetical protein [Pseudoruegeria sp. HB172150]